MLKRIRENEFVVNVAKLVSGSGIAQAIPLVLLLLFTRLFSPGDFASLEQFLMLTEILIIPATLKYEFAIMQPKKDEDAKQLLYFVLLLCFLVSLLYSVVGYFAAPSVAQLINNPDAVKFIPLVGLSVFLLGCFLAFNYWFSRKKRYGLIASNKVIETSVAEGAKIGFWHLGTINLGLVYGFITGRLAMAATFALRYFQGNKGMRVPLNAKRIRELLFEYSEYPRYTTLGSLFGRTTAWMHIFLFSIYFEPVVGFIALARRLAFAPMNIISQSFAQVFYQRISEVDDPDRIQKIYDSSLRPLIVFSVLVVVIVQLLPENTFAFVFTEKWGQAQPYIEILIFWFVTNFISTCFAFVFLRLKKQKQMLQLDILHLVLVVLSIYSGIWLDLGAKNTLILFTIAQTAFFIFMIWLGRSYVREMANLKFE
jgi:O-antigen/teichoic acid export membrane protein